MTELVIVIALFAAGAAFGWAWAPRSHPNRAADRKILGFAGPEKPATDRSDGHFGHPAGPGGPGGTGAPPRVAVVDVDDDHTGRARGLHCDCGSASFFRFGPFGPFEDDGLRLIYTCTRCGDQLRIYQASKRRAFQEPKP